MRLILAVVLSAAALGAADPPRRAPGFALPDMKMQVHDLYDYRGRPVILEFMQTTCPHCAKFVGALDKVQQKYGARVAILAVANPPDNQTTVGQYVQGHNITYPILFDMGQAAYSYLLSMHFDLPQVFLIDANGMIHRHFAYSPMALDIFEGDALLTEIGEMLATPPAAPASAAKKK